MQKRLIIICTTVILAFSIYGCAQTAEATPVAETVNAVLNDTEAERDEASNEVSDEVESDKTVAEEEYDQCEDDTEPMSSITAQDMFIYKIHDNSMVSYRYLW